MTSVIHHGPPGSYKTFALVQRILIPALQQGRVVITNIRGFNDIERIKTTLKIDIPESAQIWYLEPNIEGFKQIASFFHWAPAGALIAMDEGQRVYPTRDRGFKHLDLTQSLVITDSLNNPLIDSETNQPILRPLTLENAFDQHRHFNWDIYISTPNISKIHSEIRGVVEWAYRHRNMSGLMPWLKNTWTEFRHDAESSGKSISHYSGAPKRYTADFRVFDCYQSTATGTAKGSSENISIFRDPKIRNILIILIIAISLFIYQATQAFKRLSPLGIESTPTVNSTSTSSFSSVSSQSNSSVVSTTRTDSPTAIALNPLKDAKIYYVGKTKLDLFEVQFRSDYALTLTSDDLAYLGIQVAFVHGNYAILKFKQDVIYAWSKPAAKLEARGDAMRADSVELAAVPKQN